MKRLVFALAAIAMLGCQDVHQNEQSISQDVTRLQQQQEAISAAIKKIQVVSGASLRGGDYDMLGPVEGYCFNLPNSTSGQVTHGDSLRAAAYRKYGNQVDAIVNTTIWFVPDDASAVYEPYTENGYFECGGIAVRFNGKPASFASQ